MPLHGDEHRQRRLRLPRRHRHPGYRRDGAGGQVRPRGEDRDRQHPALRAGGGERLLLRRRPEHDGDPRQGEHGHLLEGRLHRARDACGGRGNEQRHPAHHRLRSRLDQRRLRHRRAERRARQRRLPPRVRHADRHLRLHDLRHQRHQRRLRLPRRQRQHGPGGQPDDRQSALRARRQGRRRHHRPDGDRGEQRLLLQRRAQHGAQRFGEGGRGHLREGDLQRGRGPRGGDDGRRPPGDPLQDRRSGREAVPHRRGHQDAGERRVPARRLAARGRLRVPLHRQERRQRHLRLPGRHGYHRPGRQRAGERLHPRDDVERRHHRADGDGGRLLRLGPSQHGDQRTGEFGHQRLPQDHLQRERRPHHQRRRQRAARDQLQDRHQREPAVRHPGDAHQLARERRLPPGRRDAGGRVHLPLHLRQQRQRHVRLQRRHRHAGRRRQRAHRLHPQQDADHRQHRADLRPRLGERRHPDGDLQREYGQHQGGQRPVGMCKWAAAPALSIRTPCRATRRP